MAEVNLAVEIRLAWWFKFYLYGLSFASLITGAEPSPERIAYWLEKAITFKKISKARA
jgi:hypothetical protein